ncbi:MAG: M17 family metallopeptidase [Aestuariibacter sp.]
MAFPKAQREASQANFADVKNNYDAVVFIADIRKVSHPQLRSLLTEYRKIDARVDSEALLITDSDMPGNRLISSATGPLDRYYDDVRRFYDAGRKAANIVKQSGARRPLLVVEAPNDKRYQLAAEVCYLGMTQALWQPLEARESLSEQDIEPVECIGVMSDVDVDWLNAAESGLRVARDLCGTEPERMSPPNFALYCQEAFRDTKVSVQVMVSQEEIEQEYPLLYSVARASKNVERHHARIITLKYECEGPIKHRLYLAGKGITYDTGGADLKTGGHMAGMSRDKGGAASVAGFMKMLAELQPSGLKVVAEIGAVRNSLGSEAFVADEIITSRAGVRVRIGNTDAEGRLLLADVLTHLSELAKGESEAQFFSVATLTGHAARAVGPYTALVENGKAREHGVTAKLVSSGDAIGDPAEASRSRREDYDFVRPRTSADDILSSNNAASAVTARGHQFPMAFLHMASGLDKCDVAYTHVDIAGSGVEGGDWQHGKPTGASVLMLANHYIPLRKG